MAVRSRIRQEPVAFLLDEGLYRNELARRLSVANAPLGPESAAFLLLWAALWPLLKSAYDNGYDDGYDDGFDAGGEDGYYDGYAAGSGYEYDDGGDDVYDDGSFGQS